MSEVEQELKEYIDSKLNQEGFIKEYEEKLESKKLDDCFDNYKGIEIKWRVHFETIKYIDGDYEAMEHFLKDVKQGIVKKFSKSKFETKCVYKIDTNEKMVIFKFVTRVIR